MPDSKRDYWLILITSLIAISFGVVFVARHLDSPSDGARIVPGGITSEGALVNPLRGGVLQQDDLVVVVEGRSLEAWAGSLFGNSSPPPAWNKGETLHYSVIRDGNPLDVRVTLGPYPLREVFTNTWGTIVFALIFFGGGSISLDTAIFHAPRKGPGKGPSK